MTLGNPDRPVGGLSVARPAGVELRPLGRDDFADALSLAGELYGLDPPGDPEVVRPSYEAMIGDVDATPFLAVAEGRAAGLIVHRLRRRSSKQRRLRRWTCHCERSCGRTGIRRW